MMTSIDRKDKIELKSLKDIKIENKNDYDYVINLESGGISLIEYLDQGVNKKNTYITQSSSMYNSKLVIYRYVDHIEGSEPKYLLVTKGDIFHSLLTTNLDDVFNDIVPGHFKGGDNEGK